MAQIKRQGPRNLAEISSGAQHDDDEAECGGNWGNGIPERSTETVNDNYGYYDLV